ncbi:MAG: hypothetical protein KMY55_01920 [Dethiosulfatibacter sp.]|nr:hypothetical protein [Dethiosulfatibacter sp.]
MTRKIIVLFLLCLYALVSIANLKVVYAEEASSTQLVAYSNYKNIVSKETMEFNEKKQIIEQLIQNGLDEQEASRLLNNKGQQVLNDPGDYKIEYSPLRYASVEGWVSGVPAGGVYMEYGGSFYYDPEAGASETVTVNFGGVHGSISISLNIGMRTGYVTGYSVNVPEQGYYRLWAQNTYQVQKYIIYKRVWIDDFIGYQWQEWSGGQTKVIYSTQLIPIEVR